MNLRIYLPETCQQFNAAPEEIPLKNLYRITLKRGEVISVDLHRDEYCRLVSRNGVGWVTMEGDTVDYVLAPSGVLNFFGAGRLVIETIGDETLELGARICRFPEGAIRNSAPAARSFRSIDPSVIK